jgi:hypothetical protein
MKRSDGKPRLSIARGSAKKPAGPPPYNPTDWEVGEHDDIAPKGAPENRATRGVYEEYEGFPGRRRFTVYDSDNRLLRVVEQAARTLYSRERELELKEELHAWLDREDPPKPRMPTLVENETTKRRKS